MHQTLHPWMVLIFDSWPLPGQTATVECRLKQWIECKNREIGRGEGARDLHDWPSPNIHTQFWGFLSNSFSRSAKVLYRSCWRKDGEGQEAKRWQGLSFPLSKIYPETETKRFEHSPGTLVISGGLDRGLWSSCEIGRLWLTTLKLRWS